MSKGENDSAGRTRIEHGRPRTLLLASISIILSLAFALAIGEIGARLYLFGTDAFSVRKMNSLVDLGYSGLVKRSNYPEVVYELKPDQNAYFKLHTFKTNSQGLRDAEYKINRSDKTFRVAVVGDSFTMGSGVDIENTYHSLLEKNLNMRNDDPKIEFINFGVGGYSILNYQAVIEKKILDYDPDLIMIGFTGANDYLQPYSFESQGVFKEKERVKGIPRVSYLYSMVTRSEFSFVLARLFKFDKSYMRAEELKRTEAYMDTVFGNISSVCRKNNTPVVMVYLAIGDTGEQRELTEGLAEKHGFYFVETSSGFTNGNVNDYAFLPGFDYHPNEKAHKIFANMIMTYLNKTDLLAN